MNMAIDEAILIAMMKKQAQNTVRFYRWNPSAVSIGKFQKINDEVYLDNCRTDKVDVVRRITGGGTVYHDSKDEVTYSIIAQREALNAQNITDVYANIYSGLVEALRMLGMNASFDEGNVRACPNLTVNGKKISGSAQCHKRGVVLQHGTLLLDVDFERMFRYLRVPWAKSCLEVANVAKHKITSIKAELGKPVSDKHLIKALVDGFEKSLDAKLGFDDLSAYEQSLARKLCSDKYSTYEWNYHVKDLAI